MSNLSLNIFRNVRNGDSTTSLSSLFQCLTAFSEKKFLTISNLSLPWYNRPTFSAPSKGRVSLSDSIACLFVFRSVYILMILSNLCLHFASHPLSKIIYKDVEGSNFIFNPPGNYPPFSTERKWF